MHNSLSNPESCEFNTNLVASLQYHWAICSSLPNFASLLGLGALSALVIVAQRPFFLLGNGDTHCLISCIPTLSIPIRLPILIPPPTFKGPGKVKVKVQGRVAAAHWPDGRHRPTQRQHFSVMCASSPPRMLDIIPPLDSSLRLPSCLLRSSSSPPRDGPAKRASADGYEDVLDWARSGALRVSMEFLLDTDSSRRSEHAEAAASS
ncbi:hypothetical protein MRS44_012542 [Fusarium solani]|uniref:uncharacterized protein n=1 Tax=Fusarium solani TaxID=169388 RepID=UPI0032C444C1|nr:hypothetical protein MRS44_012542 [Fusarium solani]